MMAEFVGRVPESKAWSVMIFVGLYSCRVHTEWLLAAMNVCVSLLLISTDTTKKGNFHQTFMHISCASLNCCHLHTERLLAAMNAYVCVSLLLISTDTTQKLSPNIHAHLLCQS